MPRMRRGCHRCSGNAARLASGAPSLVSGAARRESGAPRGESGAPRRESGAPRRESGAPPFTPGAPSPTFIPTFIPRPTGLSHQSLRGAERLAGRMLTAGNGKYDVGRQSAATEPAAPAVESIPLLNAARTRTTNHLGRSRELRGSLILKRGIHRQLNA